MSIEVKVEEWLRKMGYDGEIPPGLSKICNPSTSFIWEQLISNVKPRQEVEHVRKNIIVNRLLKKPIDQQDQFSFPIKELKVFLERREKEKKVEYLETSVETKSEQINELLKKNKTIYVAISHKKARIKERLEKKFLLNKKCKIFEKNIKKTEEILTLARNLTPVEMDESVDSDEVTKTLQKCAEKLEELSKTNMTPKTVINYTCSSSRKSVLKSATVRKNTLSKYLNQSTALNEIVLTNRKRSFANKQSLDVHINRCLFNNGDNDQNSKRESLGILPDDLNISAEIDSFLFIPNRTDLQPLGDSLFESNSKNNEIIEKLCSDESVRETLKNLLYANNRYLIFKHWQNAYEKILGELTFPLKENGQFIRSDSSIDKDDLTELYSVHVKTELEKDNNRLVLKKLKESVKRKKMEVLTELGNRTKNTERAKHLLELKVEEAYLTGANEFLRKEISSLHQNVTSNELQVVLEQMKRIQEEISQKNADIESLTANIQTILKRIRNTRAEASLCVRKLGPLVHNPSWANGMTQENNSKEVEIFKKFPLEFNRRFNVNQSQDFYREVSDTSFPSYLELDSNNAEMITILMDTPFSFAEDVIFNTLKTKLVLKKLLSLESSQLEVRPGDFLKHSLAELRRREQIEPFVNELNAVMSSPATKEVLTAPDLMKEIANLWLEMPFTNYISDKRLLEGHNYEFYLKVLDELYSSLPQD